MGLGCNPTLYNSSEHPNVPMWGCLGIWISKILGFRNWKTGNWRSHIPPLFHWTAASRAIVCSVSTFLSRNPQKHCTVVNQIINQPTNQPFLWVVYIPSPNGLWWFMALGFPHYQPISTFPFVQTGRFNKGFQRSSYLDPLDSWGESCEALDSSTPW